MRQLARPARAYIIGCYLAGLIALGWLVFAPGSFNFSLDEWLLAIGLGVVAATCQVFVVSQTSTTGRRSDHLTPAPVFAALLLLHRPLLALVLVAAWVPEWYIYRRSWYIQLWNIAAYVIAGALARLTFLSLTGQSQLTDVFSLVSTYPAHVLLNFPVFFIVQNLLLAWVFKLARGQSFRASGLFAPMKIVVETGIYCIGLGFVTAWLIDPRYGVAAALPLLLVFQVLHVPNLKEEASTDPKTGLLNMRHFKILLGRSVERADRMHEPFSVLMCDLDYLRNINNTYGHAAGDAVLVGIADIIRSHLSEQDTAARFGGEEFVVLLAGEPPAAQDVAERIRQTIAATHFTAKNAGTPISATMSIGIASYGRDGCNEEELLHEADMAVYQAKRDGRNRVVAASRQSRELAAEWAREHLVAAPPAPIARAAQPSSSLFSFINEMTRWSINTELPPAMRHQQAGTPTSAGGLHATTTELTPSRRSTVILHLLIAAIMICATVGLFPGITRHIIPSGALILFVGLAMLTSQLSLDTYGRGRTSIAVVAIMSAALLLGSPGILVTSLASVLILKLKSHSPLHRLLFNLGTFMLAAESARGAFYLMVGDDIANHPVILMILPAIIAGLIYYAVNHLLLCLVRGISENRRPWQIWLADYRWLWPHYAVLGGLSLVIALGYVAFGWAGVVALMAPAAMMHFALKQYIDHTADHVAALSQLNDRLTDSYEATLLALTHALDTRDEETEEHSQRVKGYTHLIAQRLHIVGAELDDMLRGALLHDIGKIGIPDAILLKPGRLTDDERAMIRKHPEIGYNMIAHIPFLSGASQVVLHHHEAYDGSGYPSGLAGGNIPLGARIFAIADTFDAMVSDRPYRRALPVNVALKELRRCSGLQFDPSLVEIFLSIPMSELAVIRQEFADFPGPVPAAARPELVLAS